MKQKYFIGLLTLIMVFGLSMTVFAAPNDDVIDALKDAGVPETYIIQAENYLKTRELTEEEASAIIEQIEIADAVMKEAGVTDATLLSKADKEKILAAVAKAGDAIGIKISIDKNADGTYTIIGVDAEGNEVVNFTTNEVKQTGADYMLLLAGLVLIAAAAVAGFASKKYIVAYSRA